MTELRLKSESMLEGPLLPNIIRYTIPIILTSLLQLMFNAADLVVVGRFCGSVSVAAVGATGSITNLIVNLFIGLSVGAGVCVAHAYGERDAQAAHRTVHTALLTALVGGVVLSVVGISCSKMFLRMMGTPENVLKLSSLYMKIYFGGMIFSMVYNFCASILRAAGDTKSPLVFLSISGVVNVVLNVIFVTVFHMNVAGVALATIISQAVSAALVVLALMKRDDACRLDPRKLRFHKAQFFKMIRIGLPAGIQGSLFSISNVLIQSSINSFGDVFMSGNAAAGNIEGFAYVCINAFSQASVNFVGQNAGAKQYDRVKKTVVACLGCVLVVGIAVGLLFYVFAEQLLSIYITDSMEAISYGVTRMGFICLTYFICGLMDSLTGGLRGLGASMAPMVICILGVCVFRVGWIYTIFQIPQYHTPQCLYLSYPISWLITFVFELIAFIVVYKKRVKSLS